MYFRIFLNCTNKYIGDTTYSRGLIENADELSFQYVDGEVVPMNYGGVDGRTEDSYYHEISPLTGKLAGFTVVLQLEWEVVVMPPVSGIDPDSVALGIKVTYKFAVEGRIGGVPIEIPGFANKVNKTKKLDDFPLHDKEVPVEDDSNEDPEEPSENEEANYDPSDDVEWYYEDDYYVDIGEIEVIGVVDENDYYYYHEDDYYVYYYEEEEEEEGDYEDIYI